ncbi:MAG: uroporphyrinogen-III synthase [Bryobacteraceae bacterium]
MILRQSGVPFVAPSVKERAVDDHSAAFEFLERLESGDFDMVVVMTGVGLAFWRDIVAAKAPEERLGAALRKAVIVSRGTKPVPILRALKVPVGVMIPEPNTWREIVEAVAARTERRIAIQEYGRPNLELNAAFEAMGATVTPFALYRWEMPDDREPLRQAARDLASGTVDVAIFTSSIQLDHLLELAAEAHLAEAVLDSLRRRVVVASVGPVMTAALQARGIEPDIIPIQPKMGALVKATAEGAAQALAAKAKGGRPR